jgi:hypothetical protein
MKFGRRLILLLGLVLSGNAGVMAPSSAGEVAATSARIAELSRTGKYSEALPLAQRQLESLEKTRGPADRDVAPMPNRCSGGPSRCARRRSRPAIPMSRSR